MLATTSTTIPSIASTMSVTLALVAASASLPLTATTPSVVSMSCIITVPVPLIATTASMIRKTTKFSFSNSSHFDDVDNDVLPYPTVSIEKNAKQTVRKGFFILTFEKVLAVKRQAAKDKKKREEEKARQLEMNEQKKRKGTRKG